MNEPTAIATKEYGTAFEAVYPTPATTQVLYDEDETKQISAIVTRLVRAKQDRDTIHPELNERNYVEQYLENERIANTYVRGKKFEGDIDIASGTVEQKLFAVLSEINRLALTPEVVAYDRNDDKLIALGTAMTDIIAVTSEVDLDEEQKTIRQLELLKQGTVFVEDRWTKEYKNQKTPSSRTFRNMNDVTWTNKVVQCYEGPRRKVLYGPGVYLGNIRSVGPMSEQPFIFTHKLITYSDAKGRYGMKDAEGNDVWPRWKHVTNARVNGINSEMITTSSATADTSNVRMSTANINNAWGLSDVKEGMVEEIHYQDRANDEFQIFLNGIAMLPVGFPLSAVSPGGEYTVEKQILQVINPFFAYGRSFVMKVREQSDILDELLRLLVIKTRKSIHPPYANTGQTVISSKVLMPGRITMGIDANALQAIGMESQGATASEFQMFKLLQEKVDENTVSRQFTGASGKSGTTAFEVATLQKQAEKILSLIIFSCTMLETKLGYQRLSLLLENYFNPIDTTFDEVNQTIVNKYRSTSRNASLGNKGQGIRQVIPTDDYPTAGAIWTQEQYTGSGGRKRSKAGLPPLKRVYLSPLQLKDTKILWRIEVDTKPKETGNAKKLLFREELMDIMALTQFGSQPNVQELERIHSSVWNRQNLFNSDQQQLTPQQMDEIKGGGGSAPRMPSASGGPGGIAPPAESSLSVAGIE